MGSKRSAEWQAWLDAICREYEIRRDDTGRFEPSPNDAFKLAALQWWTHEVGRVLIEIYATDRRQYMRMAAILSDSVAALRSLAGERKLLPDGDFCETSQDCPSGFHCDGGTCEPDKANSDPPSI